jgi:hypothetical protein
MEVIRKSSTVQNTTHKAHTTALIEVRVGAKRNRTRVSGIVCAGYLFA